MQIQLKQTEIVAALKQYIATSGISLSGKTVNISFTAGRKEAGITADISVEDAEIPGFTDAEEEAAKPVLSVVKNDPDPVQEAKIEPAPEVAEPAAKTTSLFN